MDCICEDCFKNIESQLWLSNLWLYCLRKRERGHQVRLEDVSEIMGLPKSGVATLINELERKGYVFTHEDDDCIWIKANYCSGKCYAKL